MLAKKRDTKLKVVLVCQYYPPNNTSCAVQMSDLAKKIVSLGDEVLVIFPTDQITNSFEYGELDGVKVFRVKLSFVESSLRLKRAISELLMPFIILRELWRAGFPSDHANLVVWYSPSIFFGPLVWYLKRRSSCNGYLILRDMFPEWVVDLGIMRKGLVYYFFKFVAYFQYLVADRIGVQSPSNLKYFDKGVSDIKRKTEVLENWLSPGSEEISCPERLLNAFSERKRFVYIGNMGSAQGMDILLHLVIALKNRDDIGFIFVGRGTEKCRLESMVSDIGLRNVIFHDEIRAAEVPSLLVNCDIGLLALDPKHKSHNIPGKFLSYLSAGLPVLARVNSSTDLEDIIKNHNLGSVYTGNKVEELTALALTLIDDNELRSQMSVTCKDFFNKKYSVTRAAEQILKS